MKVQFHWDRAGKYDGDSSCWLRVGTLWAGKQWGSVFIPRIGHEVIVGFLEGDPDRPIVIGSVYNADTMPPYELPANKTRSGVKTDSSMGSGGFNEIRFEDKKGSEQIFIHGQKDSDTRIENDCREWIGEDRHLIVKRDKYEEVDRDIHIDIKRDHKEKIEGDRNLTVLGKEAIQVSGTHSFQVTGDVAEQFGANHSEQTTQDFYLQANNVVLQDNASITLMVGSNFIKINALGITIMGMPMVNINSGGAPGVGTPGNPGVSRRALAAIAADQGLSRQRSRVQRRRSSWISCPSPQPPNQSPNSQHRANGPAGHRGLRRLLPLQRAPPTPEPSSSSSPSSAASSSPSSGSTSLSSSGSTSTSSSASTSTSSSGSSSMSSSGPSSTSSSGSSSVSSSGSSSRPAAVPRLHPAVVPRLCPAASPRPRAAVRLTSGFASLYRQPMLRPSPEACGSVHAGGGYDRNARYRNQLHSQRR